MTLQNKCQLVFVSRKHPCASTRFIAKPFTALVLVLLLFGVAGRLDAATAVVSSANVDPNNNELLSFVAGGVSYTQADLIQPTLTEFRGAFARNITVAAGGSVPAPGTRSMLLTHDFNLDTGIINPAHGFTAATLQFSPPLINGPGPDLVMFEVDPVGDLRDGFLVQINTVPRTYLGTSYDTQLLTVSFRAFTRDAGTAGNIFQLENDSYSAERFFEVAVYGIAIDLDDFAVDPLALVSTVHFGSAGRPGFNLSFDPTLFMGIRSAEIPEPSAITLAALGLLGVGWRRRKRV